MKIKYDLRIEKYWPHGKDGEVSVSKVIGSSDTPIEEALYGQGYAQAEDRLWSLELMRRTAHGRLAEVYGDDRSIE